MSRVIKKYTNRRLYDTEKRAYITLEDVSNLVLNGIDFKVIDARTKKDLTQNTLLQIIIEQEAHNKTPLFTNDLLKNFICFYHEKSQTALSHYLEEALHFYTQQKELIQKQWETFQPFFLVNPPFTQEKFVKKNKKKASSVRKKSAKNQKT